VAAATGRGVERSEERGAGVPVRRRLPPWEAADRVAQRWPAASATRRPRLRRPDRPAGAVRQGSLSDVRAAKGLPARRAGPGSGRRRARPGPATQDRQQLVDWRHPGLTVEQAAIVTDEDQGRPSRAVRGERTVGGGHSPIGVDQHREGVVEGRQEGAGTEGAVRDDRARLRAECANLGEAAAHGGQAVPSAPRVGDEQQERPPVSA
jgi:hypothetical protein